MSQSTSQPKLTFRELHIPGDPFVLGNVWDRGSARMLAAMGAKALATSSAAHAFTLGLPDMGRVSREEAIAHAADMAAATPLPVSGDLENGYGDDVESVVETISLAVKAGLAGCCIEDVALPTDQPYDFNNAVARIEAAVSVAREHDTDFVLTARADGVMHGQYDLAEAIRRVQAFEAVGADVLYVPMPADFDALAQICRAVDKPVNALCASRFSQFDREAFANIGVARISLGSSLARVTHQTILDAGRAIFEQGDMTPLAHAASGDGIDLMFEPFIRTSD